MSVNDDGEADARAVRPYTMTGGRTRPGEDMDLSLEALVRSTAATASPTVVLEHRRIFELCAGQLLSVAELAARLNLPLGVARVLIGDLVGDGLVTVHNSALMSTSSTTTDQLKVLESVLSGISQL